MTTELTHTEMNKIFGAFSSGWRHLVWDTNECHMKK